MMSKKIFTLFLMLVSLSSTARLDENYSNFSFHGDVYTVYIASDCKYVTVCKNVKGRFLNKKTSQDFVIKHGETINTGYGDNLRGFVFTDKKTHFTLRQPVDGNGADLSRWILTVSNARQTHDAAEARPAVFSETGDFEFLSPERFR